MDFTSIMAFGASAVSCFACGTTLASFMALGSRKNGRRNRQRRNNSRDDSEDSDDSIQSPTRVNKVSLKRKNSERTQQLAGKFMTAGWEGFSMEDAKLLSSKTGEKAQSWTPREVLAELQKGNVRFWTGAASRPEKSAFERRALIAKQFPTTAILGCSDSRVPTEIVFDQGLGDMFVIRVAGNCLDTTTTASLQYAVAHLGVKVVVVMGHEGCGAVKAAGQTVEAIDKEPEPLSTLLKGLKSNLDLGRLNDVHDSRAHDREAVVTNVRSQMEKLMEDKGIMKKVKNGELIIVGAFYEISSGIVDFPFEISESCASNASHAGGTPSKIQGVQFSM